MALVIFLLIILAALFLYGWFVEPQWLQVREEHVEVAKGSLRAPVRILFMSDLHLGRFTQFKTLQAKLKAVEALHARQPFDMIVLGGDYLDAEFGYLPRLEEILSQLKKLDLPIFAVLGNHDYYAADGKIDELVARVEACGVTVLRNAAYMFKHGSQKLALIGIDDLQSSPGYHYEKKFNPHGEYQKRLAGLDWYSCFDQYQPDMTRVLIGHNPDVVYLKGAIVPDAVLAGHTHGGQVMAIDWLARPLYALFGWFVPPGSFITWAGRRLLNHTTLLVSRGLEGSGLPYRLGRRPDVIALTLEPARTAHDLVIGVSGKPHVGKDTVANMLETLFPGMHRIAFANAIKEEYDEANGTNTLHDQEEKKKHRMGIHALGDARRAEDPDYWVKKTMRHDPPLLVTDVRLPQEVTAVRAVQGWLVRVVSNEETMRKRLGEYYDEHANHHNERWLDDYAGWDFVIHNDGTLEELEAQVLKVAETIRRRGKQHPSSR